jgi:F-type H+-transporting ATPase subunit a
MSDHVTYFSIITSNPEIQRFALGIMIASGLIYIARKVGNVIDHNKTREELLIPTDKLNSTGLIEWVLDKFMGFQDSVLGKENRKHFPFMASVFFFVLIANFLGIIPGIPSATNSIWLNVGMALMVFLYFNIMGIKEHGFFSYLRHFAGPFTGVMALSVGPLIFFAEILSTILRPFTLNLRLYWNIKGDHLVMEIISEVLGFFAFPLASPLYVLAVFVSFMQAFIFAMLTMVYVFFATEHTEEENH